LFKIFEELDNDDEKINCQGASLGLNISDSLGRVLCLEQELKGIKVESQYGVGSPFINKKIMVLKKGVVFKIEEEDECDVSHIPAVLDTDGDVSEKLIFYRLTVRGISGLFEKSGSIQSLASSRSWLSCKRQCSDSEIFVRNLWKFKSLKERDGYYWWMMLHVI